MQTQLCFLLQRAQQMQELRQGDVCEPVRVADFLMDKDQLFAKLTLDYEDMFDIMTKIGYVIGGGGVYVGWWF